MDKINLLPDESEHDVRIRFFVDPLSLGMTLTGVLLLMVIYLRVLKTNG
ncbi:hypothetical protein [Aureispira anguillae]|uniref:Uncharacterized protein n=1 Tax=Aureispira anguillae TaxID=2864201 RepID=A0A915YCJ5_9BACT|nr:hypothetical protein [Aureispira anguillae]BDS10580.1 hypothetical protein AsAng_0012880 [Aureispira anguillae]BDS10863.1 hypothetical protein AsAng_0015730 [Aureispira anguillae]